MPTFLSSSFFSLQDQHELQPHTPLAFKEVVLKNLCKSGMARENIDVVLLDFRKLRLRPFRIKGRNWCLSEVDCVRGIGNFKSATRRNLYFVNASVLSVLIRSYSTLG